MRDTKELKAVCYCLPAYNSGAMKSPNPRSGYYETKLARTLDDSGGNPTCNQGGLIILDHHIPRVTGVAEDQNNCQALTARAGTGGGNVPLIMVKEKDNEA